MNRALLPLLLLLLPPHAQAREVTSVGALEAAIATSVTAGRPVVLEFGADWCPNCRTLDKTLRDPDVQSKLRCADLIVVNLTRGAADPGAAKITQRYRLAGLPTLAFLDPEGTEHEELRLIGPVSGSRVQLGLAGVC